MIVKVKEILSGVNVTTTENVYNIRLANLGAKGNDGAQGADGLSAYEIAVLNGFVGTEQEWLDSLKAVDTNHITFDTTPTAVPETQGTLSWSEDDNALKVVLNGYKQVIGGDTFYPVTNQSGSSIAKGTAVRFAGTLGASGRLLITPFIGDGSVQSSFFMGVTAETIADGAEGKVLWFGRIRGIDTSAFSAGDVLYASTTTAGAFQTAVPQAPNNIVQVAAVINSHANNGTIFVRPTIGSNINKDEGVSISNPQNGEVLTFNATSGLFENVAPAVTNPAGTNGQIQFNNNGAFGAHPSLFWNATNLRLELTTSNLAASHLLIKNATTSNRLTLKAANADSLIEFNNRLFFLSGTTLSINQSGNVGIGQNNPNRAKFQVIGNTLLGESTTSAGARLDVRAQGALSTDIAFRVRNSADTANHLTVRGNGTINMANLPTSSAGLVAGDLWNNGGVLNIV